MDLATREPSRSSGHRAAPSPEPAEMSASVGRIAGLDRPIAGRDIDASVRSIGGSPRVTQRESELEPNRKTVPKSSETIPTTKGCSTLGHGLGSPVAQSFWPSFSRLIRTPVGVMII